jgi:hypothetical protein
MHQPITPSRLNSIATNRPHSPARITKVEWTNPHAFFYVDLKDAKTGLIMNWVCELPSPKALAVRGWTTDTLKVGMTVNVHGILARDGGRKLNARTVAVIGGSVLCAANC